MANENYSISYFVKRFFKVFNEILVLIYRFLIFFLLLEHFKKSYYYKIKNLIFLLLEHFKESHYLKKKTINQIVLLFV